MNGQTPEREPKFHQLMGRPPDKDDLFNWSNTDLVEFLMREGQRGPRRALRGKSRDWLVTEALAEGAIDFTCSQCSRYSKDITETGRCEDCELTAQEIEHDEALCDCPCHADE